MILLETVQDALFSDENVIAAAVLGSLAADESDEWSDLDILLIVKQIAHPHWLKMPLYGREIHSQPEHTTFHCLYQNMQIIDYVLIELGALEANHQLLEKFQHKALKILFSRDETITRLLEQVQPAPLFSPLSDAAFEEFQLRFWYQARYAIQRIIRNDLLIGLHLALELFQTLLVMRMILRDRETGTNYHRTGGTGNQYLEGLKIQAGYYSSNGILEFIAALIH